MCAIKVAGHKYTIAICQLSKKRLTIMFMTIGIYRHLLQGRLNFLYLTRKKPKGKCTTNATIEINRFKSFIY